MKTPELLFTKSDSYFPRIVCSGERLSALMGFGKDTENRIGVGKESVKNCVVHAVILLVTLQIFSKAS